jgi:putative intracellular protease/amidase
MRKYLLLLLVVLYASTFYGQHKKILFVATNIDTLNGKPNGTFLIEIAIPFQYFTDKGYEVDIVSPKGGKIPLYYKFDTTEVLKRVIEDSLFIYKTSHSLKPSQVKANEYCAVFYAGGYGQFWDVYPNKKLAIIAVKIYTSGGVLGSTGHGASSLLSLKLNSTTYLVKGKTLTCFPTWAEKEFMEDANFGALLPFDMETEFRAKEATLKMYAKEKDNKEDLTVVDDVNRMVTASFADTGEFVAQQMHQLILKNGGK